jgi:hypothetical protein
VEGSKDLGLWQKQVYAHSELFSIAQNQNEQESMIRGRRPTQP